MYIAAGVSLDWHQKSRYQPEFTLGFSLLWV